MGFRRGDKGLWGAEDGQGTQNVLPTCLTCPLGIQTFLFLCNEVYKVKPLKLHETRLKGIKVTPGKALLSLPSLLDLSGVLARAEGPVLPLRTGLLQGCWGY